MSDFEKLLTTIAKVLQRLDIPYFITGGAAVVLWGRPRFTADIDIVVELDARMLRPLAQELRKELGENAYIDEAMMAKEQARQGEFNVIQPQTGLKADFFFLDAKEPYKRKQFMRAVVKDVQGIPVQFISPEDLILQKLLWYRESLSERHLEDARSVKALQGTALDAAYLEKQAEQLGVKDELGENLTV